MDESTRAKVSTPTLERRTRDTNEIRAILGVGRDEVQKLVRRGVFRNLGTSRKILVSDFEIRKYLGEA